MTFFSTLTLVSAPCFCGEPMARLTPILIAIVGFLTICPVIIKKMKRRESVGHAAPRDLTGHPNSPKNQPAA